MIMTKKWRFYKSSRKNGSGLSSEGDADTENMAVFVWHFYTKTDFQQNCPLLYITFLVFAYPPNHKLIIFFGCFRESVAFSTKNHS